MQINRKNLQSQAITGSINSIEKTTHHQRTWERSNQEKAHSNTNQNFGIPEEFISLRNVNVVLSNGKVRMTENTLLENAGTKTYTNSDLVKHLKLKGIPKQVTVDILKN